MVTKLEEATVQLTNAAASISLLREESERSLYFPLCPADMNALELEDENGNLTKTFVSE